MILLEIKQYLKHRAAWVPLFELSTYFQVPVLDMEYMVMHWIQKGQVEKLEQLACTQKTTTCQGSTCHSGTQFYRWHNKPKPLYEAISHISLA